MEGYGDETFTAIEGSPWKGAGAGGAANAGRKPAVTVAALVDPIRFFNRVSLLMNFEYSSIYSGYYDRVFHRGKGVQSKWHHLKFKLIRERLGEGRRHLGRSFLKR